MKLCFRNRAYVAGGPPTSIIAATPFARMNTHEEASLTGLTRERMQVSACGVFPRELSWEYSAGLAEVLQGSIPSPLVVPPCYSLSINADYTSTVETTCRNRERAFVELQGVASGSLRLLGSNGNRSRDCLCAFCSK